MPRPRRSFEPNVSIHAIHRGNNRSMMFCDDADYELFLAFLEYAAARFELAVHAFALMTTHYHLHVTPQTREALPRAMKSANGRYVRYFNRKYERMGTLLAGRYRPIAIVDDNYWLTCLRYVELNPVRARMVRDPAQYRWSSYRAHALGESIDWLAPHPIYDALGATPAERQAAYRALCKIPLTETDMTLQHFHPGPHKR
jgi:putative transposase